MEKEIRYIYNPFILNFIYQKVIHLDRIKRIAQCEFEKIRVCRENLHSEQIIEDVYCLLSLVRQTTYKIDIYYCNYEYILHRMLHIFRPFDMKFVHHAGDLEGDAFFCELKCFNVVGIDENEMKRTLFDIMKRYITTYYVYRLIDYENIAAQRSTALFRIKTKYEEKLRPRDKNMDYSFSYNGDVLITLMYIFFMNQFSCMLNDEKTLLLLRGECTDAVDAHLKLLESLHDILEEQYELELKGYVLIASHGADDVNKENDPYVSSTLIDRERVYFRFKNIEENGFTLVPRQIEHLRYILLHKNRHLYCYMTRRFIFDYNLQLLHADKCQRSENTNKYLTIECQLCRYFKQLGELMEFYSAATSYAYHTCHYIIPNAPQLENRAKLHKFLETLMLDRVDDFVSIIYKNAWQLLVLMLQDDYDVFRMIDVMQLINTVRLDFDMDGGHEARLTCIIKETRHNFKITQRPEKWHRKLALDIDVTLLIIHAILKQQDQMDQYRRNAPIQTRCEDIKTKLIEIYQLYRNLFSKTMAGY